MLGAVIGDICGSTYEFNNLKTDNPRGIPLFPDGSTFTDDTVMTVAAADKLLTEGFGGTPELYAKYYRKWGRKYPDLSYGVRFGAWLAGDGGPYNSFGNGSAMRVAPVGFAAATLEQALEEAELSALPTHNHPEGVKGAQAVAAAIFLLKRQAPDGRWLRYEEKIQRAREVRAYVEETFGYNLIHRFAAATLRPGYTFDETCQGTVPQALSVAFDILDRGDGFGVAIQEAISIGGDSDTVACIVGGVVEAGVKIIGLEIGASAFAKLPPDIEKVIRDFRNKNRISVASPGYDDPYY